jgi:5-dehydro-2-deoxygluconokinase
LAHRGAGDVRYVASEAVTASLRDVLPQCDLIVGTEEEIRVAGGAEDVHTALHAIRAVSSAAIVLKRGPMGCVVFAGAIPDQIEDGISGAGFPIEVYNVLGAGDAFMAGFLRGWLRNEDWKTCCTWANACGAFAVSRLLCAPEYPSWTELQHLLTHGSPHRALRHDPVLNHLHHTTTRRPAAPTLMALAIDHRPQMEKLADRAGADHARINDLKRLAVQAALRVANGAPGYGVLLDSTYGREALFDAEASGLWIGRPIERPGSRPLRFEHGHDPAAQILEWPATQTVKCLCFCHPDDPPEMKAEQEEKLLTLAEACRRLGREYMIEIIASRHGPVARGTAASVLRRLYHIGLRPDWWKLEAQPDHAAWADIASAIENADPFCRGVVVLGLEAPLPELIAGLEIAARSKWVRGFAVGRSIFVEPAERWLAGMADDEATIAAIAENFRALTMAWQRVQAAREAA